MFIPSNHERIQTISELFRADIDRHEAKGGTYDDEEAARLAAEAIQTCMPELAKLQNERLVVEAGQGIALEGKQFTRFEGLRVEAKLARVSIQQLVSTIKDEEFDSVRFSSFDLFAVLTPRYVDPDPTDIVFGEELLVPFAEVERFEVVNS